MKNFDRAIANVLSTINESIGYRLDGGATKITHGAQFIEACAKNMIDELVEFWQNPKNRSKLHEEDLHEALYQACDHNFIKIIKFLIEDVGLKDHINTPLRTKSDVALGVACSPTYSGSVGDVIAIEIADYLIKNGADVNHGANTSHLGRGQRVSCPLARAAISGGRYKLVEFLIKAGADVHANDEDALLSACGNGQDRTIEVLIKHGADVHINNEAPLETVIRSHEKYSKGKCMNILLSAGADFTAENPLVAYIEKFRVNESSNDDMLKALRNHYDLRTLKALIDEKRKEIHQKIQNRQFRPYKQD